MLIQTSSQYDLAVSHCRDIFVNKMKDYGSAWRILRVSSITDQVYIKAQRIRSIETHGTQKVEEGIRSEYIGIVNYAMIALIQLELQFKRVSWINFTSVKLKMEFINRLSLGIIN